MTSKKYSCSISGALIKEDFKRFWALPLLASAVYLFEGLSSLILLSDEWSYPNMITEMLSGRFVFFSILNILVPAVAVMLTFSYNSSFGRVSVSHAQPFTRAQMMNSHGISALVFSAVPVIIMGLVLLMMAHPVYSNDFGADAHVNLFTRAAVLKWTAKSLVSVIYVLALCVLAVTVTGTAAHNLIAIAGLNVMVPLAAILAAAVLDNMLYGFSLEEYADSILGTHSVTAFYCDRMNGGHAFIYLVLSAAIYAVSLFLYSRRKTERTSEGFVFRLAEYAATMLFGFFGSVYIGILFYEITGEIGISMAAFAAASLICLLIFRMIVAKSLKIFNLKILKIIGIYAVITVLFLAAAAADVTGYEARIPDDAKTAKLLLPNGGEYIPLSSYDHNTYIEVGEEDEELIKSLHKEIVDKKDLWEKYDKRYMFIDQEDETMQEWEYCAEVEFLYEDAAGKVVEARKYTVPQNAFYSTEAFRELYKSNAFKNNYQKFIPDADKITAVKVEDNAYNEVGELISDKEKIREFREALMKDYESMDLWDFSVCCEKGWYGARMRIIYDRGEGKDSWEDDMEIYFSGSFRNTIAWLGDNGFSMDEILSADCEFSMMTIFELKDGKVKGKTHSDYDALNEKDIRDSGAKEICTDPKQMTELYSRAGAFIVEEKADTVRDGLYYIEIYDYTEEWEEYEMEAPYSIVYRGYVKQDDLREILTSSDLMKKN